MSEWRPAPWRKLWGTFVDSRKLRGIGSHARSILATAIASAWWDGESPEGRVMRAASKPTTPDQLMDDAEVPVAARARAWAAIVDVDALRVVDGVITLPRFDEHQQGRSTKRTRAFRERSGNTNGTRPEQMRNERGTVEVDAEADADAEEPPVVPAGDNPANDHPWLESPAEARDCDKPSKPSRRKPRVAPPDELVTHVLAELRKAVQELDPSLSGPRDTPGNRELLAKLHAAEMPTAEQWSTVIRRQLASVRNNPAAHKYLALSTLCVPRNFSRLLDAPAPRGGTGGGTRPWAAGNFEPTDTP